VVVEAELPRSARSASLARSLVASFERDLGPVQHGDAILAVSELVANAYLHGRGRISLQLESRAGGLRARVDDEGTGFAPNANGGMGLSIVRAVSDAWGLEEARSRVWFEIRPAG
jgi:anti-sigma regulatory factor (Ser/Thr protein kinase)